MRIPLAALIALSSASPLFAQVQTPFEPFERVAAPDPGDRIYAKVEYVYWFLRQGRMPPILTTGSAASGGVLGAPDTRIVYGGDRLESRHFDRFIGARPTLGFWLDRDNTTAIEVGAFFLERDSTYFKAVSDGSVLLARPFFDPDGTPKSEIIAGPLPGGGVRTGAINGYSRVEVFGQEANLTILLTEDANSRCDLLLGARFLQMRDRADSTATGWLLPDKTTLFGLTDHFRAGNQFYGGQAGLRGEHRLGNWFVNGRGVGAVGGTNQLLRAYGTRIVHTPAARTVETFGLTTQPSNTGRFSRVILDGVCELGVNAGYQPKEWLRIYAGYTLLGWLNPVRAGDQIDLVVNTNQPAGAARPAIPFKEDFFWAHGFNVGLEVRW